MLQIELDGKREVNVSAEQYIVLRYGQHSTHFSIWQRIIGALRRLESHKEIYHIALHISRELMKTAIEVSACLY